MNSDFGSDSLYADVKVLLIGDDMRSFLTCARSFGRNGIEVHAVPFNWTAPALSSKYINEVHKLPRMAQSVDNWVENVCELQLEHDFDLIIPCDERALLPLRAVPEDKRNFRLAEPGSLALEHLFDKAKTRDLAQSLDIPVASGTVVDHHSNAQLIVSQLGLPLMLKSRMSYSIEKLEVRGEVSTITSIEALDDELRKFEGDDSFVVESFFPTVGEASGVGVSVAAREGAVLAAFQHRRLVEKPGGGSSSVRVSEALDPDMLWAVEKICNATKLNGVAMFEFRQSADNGEWILLEVNARPWGSMPLPLALDIDFPMMLLDIYLGKLGAYNLLYKPEIVGKNLALSILHQYRSEGRSGLGVVWFAFVEVLKHAVNCMRGKEVSDSFVRDDLRPAVKEFPNLVKRGIDRVAWGKDGAPERRKSLNKQKVEPAQVERTVASKEQDYAEQRKKSS
ncbi:hypothetical protein [Maritalea sp.]|jgi:predicted ATP-grasp superfamily ATP-dependent carboligase|uniref:carboxylate--amine ligase n=1 Tax=Maritalea sp. TaxID=2003361 RepID=UPI0039E26386